MQKYQKYEEKKMIAINFPYEQKDRISVLISFEHWCFDVAFYFISTCFTFKRKLLDKQKDIWEKSKSIFELSQILSSILSFK